MRFLWVALLVASSFLVTGDAAAATTDTKLIIADQMNFPAKRALRTRAKQTGDDEERGFLDAITGSLPRLTDKQLVGLAKSGTPINKVFQDLHLNRGMENILDETNLRSFATYIRIFDPKNPDEILISTITKKYGEMDVARFIYKAKQVKGSEKLAGNLQATQFLKWIKAKQDPTKLWNTLELTYKRAYTELDQHVWVDFIHAYAYVISHPKKYAYVLS
uniref:RxLR effector protein n=1 Tax=Phytophthora agathidicida TaxID=1642459 RepID=A0A7G4WI19_9STRA|nr:PaRXLR30 [Phytophthora agathidicida]